MNTAQRNQFLGILTLTSLGVWLPLQALVGQTPPRPTFVGPGGPGMPGGGPPMVKDGEGVLKGLDKVVSTSDGAPSMYTLYINKKDAKVIAELPKDVERKKYFIALTVAGGEIYAGLQAGDLYVYWKNYNDRLALIEPDLDTRSTGDPESKSSVERLFTGRIIADVAVLGKTMRQGTLIDMVDLLLVHAPKFFGFGRGGLDPKAMRLRTIKTAKAFPHNIELAFEVPSMGGKLKTLHFSISEIPDHTGYQPRQADDRVGYFTTAFNDLGKFKKGETRTRYINRWYLEKADPSLKMSPPRQPIVFYIEHTTPIRYRRFVRDGILYWNKAFEKVGLVNAIEVYFQDARTGAHMEKDPEDVRYNFIRWLSNNQGTAIGPSRVHPLTGQILDADIILTDGWIRHFERQFGELLPQLALEGFGPDALAWLECNPQWDPRFLLASPHQRNTMLIERSRRGFQPLGGHPSALASGRLMGDHEFDGLVGRVSQINGLCLAAQGKAFDLALLRMSQDLLIAEEAKLAPAQPKKQDGDDELDGMPARFIGPLLADLVAHEVGHTLGLRHNFKASALYRMSEVNSKKLKGQKPYASSVMDYLPININMNDGEMQGDYAMIDIGPYDMWAIEYGYTFDKELKPILARCTLPENQYGTDQDTLGPDPLARRYDFSANPLEYAKNQMKLARYHRERLLSKFVADGESWSKARKGYELTLSLQMRSLSMMANWVGGALVHRDHKGDKGNRAPIDPVPAATQRAALVWTVENSFKDEAFGLTPAVLQRLKTDSLVSDESFFGFQEATFPIHDRIMGVQSTVLTMLLNPTRLRRIYDNESLVDQDKDALTLPELMATVTDNIFSEVEKAPQGKFSARKPAISSLRRNLQRELVDRLIALAQPNGDNSAAAKPISNLALEHLRQLKDKIGRTLQASATLDPYTRAHLRDAEIRITKALDAPYIFNARDLAPRFPTFFLQPTPAASSQGCNHPGCQCQGLSWDARSR
jgi:uncharacterized protein DUF4953/uncharacterized protein DUF5117